MYALLLPNQFGHRDLCIPSGTRVRYLLNSRYRCVEICRREEGKFPSRGGDTRRNPLDASIMLLGFCTSVGTLQ